MKINIRFFNANGARTTYRSAHRIEIQVDDADLRERVEAQGSAEAAAEAFVALLSSCRDQSTSSGPTFDEAMALMLRQLDAIPEDPDEGKTKEEVS